ncbi:MAG: RsmB/NOP family class I SAM-dependent RNA methyltransferase [Pseudomonadota bacterium]
MTPAARLSAAIAVLDRILDGEPAEKALTNWGRANRFAGSGDRAALRDLVFDALRCKRSCAALGGAMTGRGLILGQQRQRGADLDALFTGIGHAPAVVQASEAPRAPQGAEAMDCPDWLLPLMQASLGDDTEAVLRALQQRAPVFLRVNLARATVAAAQADLAAQGIASVPHALAKTALEVTENARKIQNAAVYLDGMVELQDAASQAVVQALPLRDGLRVLDHCAGGGGKTLAMAAQAKVQVFAHDANPRRMADLPARANRAGAQVAILDNPEKAGPYDLILTDVPCSGSGSWRRDPMGKWALTPEILAKICTVQAGILDRVAPMVAAAGVLAYATCSLLRDENEAQIDAFLARTPGWVCRQSQRFSPLSGGDGFFIAILTRI